MAISTETSIVIIALVLLGLFLFVRCDSKHHKDNFTRAPFGVNNISKFGRSPVDYAMKVEEGAWAANPTFQANPSARYQPLENAPIDFYADERKLDDGTLWEQYGPNWVDGIKLPYLTNDEKTRTLLRENGQETIRRSMDQNVTPRHLRSPVKIETEMDFLNVDPWPDNAQPIGGWNYLVHKQIAS